MRRIEFLKRTVLISTVMGMSPVLLPTYASQNDSSPIIKPSRLKTGDLIGLTAPGSFISESELQDSITNLEKLGFRVYYSQNILARYGYLAGTDIQRRDDLHHMFTKKEVKGIMCARGGYGCSRILPLLDYDLIRQNPKILVGYSDITALCYGIFSKTGLICFHGPVAISTFNDFSISYFNRVLLNPEPQLLLTSAINEDPDKQNYSVVPIRSGKSSGQLAGGNLSIVVSLIGTPYDINCDGKIVFLEEIGEEPYRVDRMLTQMIEAGKFNKAAGIALGIFDKCEPKQKNAEFDFSFSLMEVLMDRLYNLGIPVIYGLSFGHITNKFTLPVGINAELDVDNQTLRLLEQAVV